MQIKYVKARNFLSVGEEPLEIDFSKFGNIVNIVGENVDDGGSNGAGKSTIAEIVVYGLYGKLLKGLNHNEAINIYSKKGMEVEVHFDNYRVVRRRKPDSLHVYNLETGEQLDLGGMPATQEWLEKETRLGYNAFVNVAYFGQHNRYTFLAASAKEKREIAENLLSLDRYLAYSKQATDGRKVIKSKIENLSGVYQVVQVGAERTRRQLVQATAQQKDWVESRRREVESLKSGIAARQKELLNTEDGALVLRYDEAQVELASVNERIASGEATREKVAELTEGVVQKYTPLAEERANLASKVQQLELQISRLEAEIAKTEHDNATLAVNEGGQCKHCFGTITKDNFSHILTCNLKFIETKRTEMAEAVVEIAAVRQQLAAVSEQVEKLQRNLKAGRSSESDIACKLKVLYAKRQHLSAVNRPDSGAASAMIQQQIELYRERMQAKVDELAGGNPFDVMVATANEELEKQEADIVRYRTEIGALEQKLPYYDYWVKAFGDDGIRAFVLEEILPALNSRINYWLQFLIDNRIQLHFNNKLEETIERNPADGHPFVYNSLSGGQHQRIDIAISQAFAHVMTLTSGNCPSIVFLDEIGTDFDLPGIHAVYKMICELSRDRQVFVTTHHPELASLLENCDRLTVRLENKRTRVVN